MPLEYNSNYKYLNVPDSSLNSSLSSDNEKCFSTFSSWSTTQELNAFLCSCLCKIFSSIVPNNKQKFKIST